MDVQIHTDLQTFADQVRPFLLRDEADNNVMLGMLHRRLTALRNGQQLDKVAPPLFCSVIENGEVVGVASQTAPYSLNLTRMSLAAIKALVESLAEHAFHLYGAHGPSEIAAAFAAAWTSRQAAVVTRRKSLFLYKLNSLLPAKPCAGSARLATMDDMAFLLKCQITFNEELQLPASDDETEVANRIAMRSTYIWNTTGPVATAGFRIVTNTCARIVSVYVVPEHRRQGYASALTCAVTEHAQRLGYSTVFLFTDAEDEAPNIVYTRLGYVRVGEYTDYRFGETHRP